MLRRESRLEDGHASVAPWLRQPGWGGELDVAATALSEAKRLQPSLSLDWVETSHPIVRVKDRAVDIQGLRLAGLR
jgi:adenylate cyclase